LWTRRGKESGVDGEVYLKSVEKKKKKKKKKKKTEAVQRSDFSQAAQSTTY
jgi:hypothetical protein